MANRERVIEQDGEAHGDAMIACVVFSRLRLRSESISSAVSFHSGTAGYSSQTSVTFVACASGNKGYNHIVKLKTIFNIESIGTHIPVKLSDLGFGEIAVVDDFDLPEQVAEQLMNLGLIPGLEVALAHSGPGNTPRIYRVDGTEFALRRGVAEHILLRQPEAAEVRL